MDDKPKLMAKENPARKERDTRIAELRVQGQTMEQIGREVGVHKSTVSRVLSDDEVQSLVDESARRVLNLVPAAVDVFTELLYGDEPKIKQKVADRVLQIAGISPSHAPAQVIQNIYSDHRTQSNTIQIDAIRGVLRRNLGLQPDGSDGISDGISNDTENQAIDIDKDNGSM